MKNTTTQLVIRARPCNCGCQGQDPWHRASYRRVVTLLPGSDTEGTVQHPGGITRVSRKIHGTLRDGRTDYGTWVFDGDHRDQGVKFKD
jgi:hypothetical protein